MSTEASTADARGLRKFQEGLVASSKMQKSIVVLVTTKQKHPAYGKYVTRTKRYVAHDEKNECGVGDRVRIIQTRPISKTKRWRLETIIEKAA